MRSQSPCTSRHQSVPASSVPNESEGVRDELGTVPFVGGWACTDRYQPVWAQKGDARIMPALYDHLRLCIPKIFTIRVDRISVGYRWGNVCGHVFLQAVRVDTMLLLCPSAMNCYSACVSENEVTAITRYRITTRVQNQLIRQS
jgi:hypothetical protein